MNNFPPILPSVNRREHPKWWADWVRFVRESPGLIDRVGDETFHWGEHLFLGWETHNRLFRAKRAVGITAPNFTDVIDYQDVSDLRAWQETEPRPLLLHERLLSEHCYILGPSGTGKTSLGIMPLLIQLMRGSKTATDELSPPYPIVILDLKGDQALFHTVKYEAERRGQIFKFMVMEKDAPTYRFNPFRGFDRSSRTVAQLCQLILDALSLNHGKGYGRSYYTERSRSILSTTLKRNENISSFTELYAALRTTLAGMSDSRARYDAFELVSVIEMLTEYPQLVTGVEDDASNRDGIIFMPDVLRERQVSYFWLPAALESISVGEIAKLVLFNLRIAAQDWKRKHPHDKRRVILVIDELQRVAGENLQGLLQDARAFGISAILANQSLKDLKSQTGFDLAPTIMTNTRVKLFFTSTSESECHVYVERGKGFTEARPYPQLGNPWLKDLGPDEFAYHSRLAWPMSLEEYEARETTPLPGWDAIPGGDSWLERKPVLQPNLDLFEPSDALPREFPLTRDDEWQKQVASISALFTDAERKPSQDDAISFLMEDEPEIDEEA